MQGEPGIGMPVAGKQTGDERAMTANSFGSRATLRAGETDHTIHRLDAVPGADNLPFSLKVLLENLLRNEDGRQVTADHITALAGWDPAADPATEIQFTPARVLMQDFTGVPCVVDLVAMRDAMTALGGIEAEAAMLGQPMSTPGARSQAHRGAARGHDRDDDPVVACR